MANPNTMPPALPFARPAAPPALAGADAGSAPETTEAPDVVRADPWVARVERPTGLLRRRARTPDRVDLANQFQHLFELVPIPIIVTTPQANIRHVNGAACELLRRDLRFLEGKPLPLLVHITGRATFRSNLAMALGADDVCEFVSELWRIPGPPAPVAITVRTNRGQDGRPLSLYWVFRDDSVRDEVDFL